MNGTSATDRVAISLPEARLDHGLSQRQLAALSGVSATTIRKVERGGRVDPVLLVRLGVAFVVLDVFGLRRFDDEAWLPQAASAGRWAA